MRIQAGLMVVGLSISLLGQAAAPVVDIGSSSQSTAQTGSRQPVATRPAVVNPPAGDMHYQLQVLQDEVRTLRGMVEELTNEVNRLKTRQLDDYMDLDRRISSKTSGAVTKPVQPSLGDVVVNQPIKPVKKVAPVRAGSSDETEHYSNAYNQLKSGNVDEAIKLFKAHNSKYPNGKYVANSHYWLGEIYMLKNQLEKARGSFSMVVDSFPAHRKASDSRFKLGQVYHMLGNNTKAKALLEKAASGNDNAARLAKGYLDKNF